MDLKIPSKKIFTNNRSKNSGQTSNSSSKSKSSTTKTPEKNNLKPN